MTPERRQLIAAAAGLWAAAAARAQIEGDTPPPEVAAELPGARVQGRATLRFLGLRVYDSRLWVGDARVAADWAAAPFALELQYARELKGTLIAERSLAEMRRQGEITADTGRRWLDQMQAIFPDVKGGDRITGFNRPGQGARFFYNGSPRGESKDADFARWFFGIWFSPKTSEPALRSALLGAGA